MNDKLVESYEEFTVHLRTHKMSDSYYPQTIDPDTATIRILDNDCKSAHLGGEVEKQKCCVATPCSCAVYQSTGHHVKLSVAN